MTDTDKHRARARCGDADRALKFLDQAPDRRPDPGFELYDLPASEIDRDYARPDPWWLMPASLLLWALIAVGVVMLMTALVS